MIVLLNTIGSRKAIMGVAQWEADSCSSEVSQVARSAHEALPPRIVTRTIAMLTGPLL